MTDDRFDAGDRFDTGGSFDTDDVRALFQQVQPPPGVGRWREINEARELPGPYQVGPARPGSAPRGTRRDRRRPPRLRAPRRRSLAIVATMLAIAVVSGAIPTAFRLLRVTEAATGGGHPAAAASAPATSPPPASPSAAPSMALSAAPASAAPGPSGPPASGWPTARTTGVPAGTALRPHPGDLTVATAGAVVDGVSVTGTIVVTAPNVTIRRTRVTPARQAYWAVRQMPGATNLTIEDTEIAGGAQTGVSQEAAGLVVRRCSIHDAQTGVVARGSVTVQDSLLYGLGTGIADQGGVTGVTVVHNAITSTAHGEAAIALYTNAGPLSGVTIDGNLLSGGNYTLYAGGGAGSHDIRITRNHFGRGSSGKSGYYGPVTAWDARARGNVWSTNVYDDNGAPVRP
jgi:Right handed beta helix region